MIRKLQRRDVPVCHRLQNQQHFHSDWGGVWSIEKWYHLWEFLTDSWVYVDENDVVLGYMIGRIHHAEVLNGELAYNWMDTCVSDSLKGSNITHEMQMFIQETYPLVWGVVHVDNERMLKYCYKHGWEDLLDENGNTRVFKKYYSDGKDAIVMTVSLERWQSG